MSINTELSLRDLLKVTFTDKKINEIVIKEICTGGANFSSTLYNVKIKCNGEQDLELFAKVSSWPASARAAINVDTSYELERYFYTDPAPKFEIMQTKYGIEGKERFYSAKLYGYNTKYLEETFILDNLIAKGYTLYDRFKTLDWDYSSKAVEELAKFHALSFALEKEYPETYLELKSKLTWKNSFFLQMKTVFRATANTISKHIPEELKERFENFVSKQLVDEIFEKYYSPRNKGTFVHGDYRPSNIMYKRSQDGKVPNLIPVDYQTLQFCSPVIDLLYLIYNGTDEEFRRHHLQNLLNHYYNTLANWLQKLDHNPETVYSRNEFNEEYIDMMGYGLYTATFCLPVVLVDINNVPQINTDNLDNFAVKISDEFFKRYLPIFKEFVAAGVI